MRSNFPSGRSPTSPEELERMRVACFHKQNVANISLDDPRLPWQEKELLEQICARLYGPRVKNNQENSDGNGR